LHANIRLTPLILHCCYAFIVTLQDGDLRSQLEESLAAYEHLRTESAREIRRLKREAKAQHLQAEAHAVEHGGLLQMRKYL
jgi:hypothetical protein